jgi:N-acetylmuramoyl-L-alanine amidase
MFFSFKLKSLILVVLAFLFALCAGTIIFVNAKPTGNYNVPNAKYTVVIDAGHGGIDGGSVGKFTGVCESELNLVYAYNLAEQFKQMGITSVLTRTDSNGLYDKNAKSLKKSDMQKRKEIIDKTNPDVVISIHMDSFALSSTKGAQAFFKKGNNEGEVLANCVQNQLATTLSNAKKSAKVGDYYLVNCTNLPAVLVECGFISNKEEEVLLQTKAYQDKVCYGIMSGVLDFLNNRSN